MTHLIKCRVLVQVQLLIISNLEYSLRTKIELRYQLERKFLVAQLEEVGSDR